MSPREAATHLPPGPEITASGPSRSLATDLNGLLSDRSGHPGTAPGLPLLVERLTIHVLQELREVEELRDELFDVGRALHASLPGRRHRVELSVCDVEPERRRHVAYLERRNTREARRHQTVATVLTCRSAAGYAGW